MYVDTSPFGLAQFENGVTAFAAAAAQSVAARVVHGRRVCSDGTIQA
jgi:hypothetical protein